MFLGINKKYETLSIYLCKMIKIWKYRVFVVRMIKALFVLILCRERELINWLVLIPWTALGMDSLCGMSYKWFLRQAHTIGVLCCKILYGACLVEYGCHGYLDWTWMSNSDHYSNTIYLTNQNFFL